MFVEPFVHVEEVALLAPEHPRQRLPHDIGRIFADAGWRDRVVERVGLALALGHGLCKGAAKRIADGAGRGIGQPKPDDGGLSRPDIQLVVRGCLGPRLLRIDGVLLARHNEIVDAVLHIGVQHWASRSSRWLLVSFSVNSSGGLPSQYRK